MKRALVVVAVAMAVAFAAGIVVQTQTQTVPGPVILKGAPMGGVKFVHKTHEPVKCDTCHHASKPEMPAKAANQKCTDCHTKAVKAPMKTKTQAAFHDALAKTGLCVTCHMEKNKAGGKAPLKCAECHKKENV